MTQASIYTTPNGRAGRFGFHENNEIYYNDVPEKSYEANSEIYPKSNGSDSFTTIGHSSHYSRKSEIRTFRSERFLAKLSRSASTSPRVDYNSNSFAESMKSKPTHHHENSLITTDHDRSQDNRLRLSSQNIDDLDNQWKAMKQHYSAEPRKSNSPNRFHLDPDSPGRPRSDSSRSIGKERLEGSSTLRKSGNFERNQPITNLLSKVIPQAKINLVQPQIANMQSRSGIKHSKSLEPKQGGPTKGEPSYDRSKKADPMKAIYNKYSNVNRKKETREFEKEKSLSDRGNILDTEQTDENRYTDRNLTERENLFEMNYHPYSPDKPKLQVDTGNKVSSQISDPTYFKTATVINHQENPLKSPNGRSDGKIPSKIKSSSSLAHFDYLKAKLGSNSIRSNNTQYTASLNFKSTENSRDQDLRNSGSEFGSHRNSQRGHDDNKTRILYYESTLKEEQESLFHVPATMETIPMTQKSPCTRKISLNIVKSEKINLINRPEIPVGIAATFDISYEREPNETKFHSKEYFDDLTERVKSKIKDIKRTSDEMDSSRGTEEVESRSRLKYMSDLSIQKPFQFTTKESNFSPCKNVVTEGYDAFKYKKDHQHKYDQKYSSIDLKQAMVTNNSHILKEKSPDNTGSYYINEKSHNTSINHPAHSSRPKGESISIKAELISLESARLQKYQKVNGNTPVLKASVLYDIKNKELFPMYALVTNESGKREFNIEQHKSKNKKTKSSESIKHMIFKKGDENSLKHKGGFVNDSSSAKIDEKLLKNKGGVKIKK